MNTAGIAYDANGHEIVVGSRAKLDRGTLPAHTSASICTYTGVEFFPLEPRVEDIRIVDIAHALSQIVRYTGHVAQQWTVGLHCIEVSHRVYRLTGNRETALAGLLHDASEAYIADVARPIKASFTNYAAIERRLEAAIFERYGLPYPFEPVIKEVDNDMLLDEAANFFSPGSFIWKRYSLVDRRNHPSLAVASPLTTRTEFLRRFTALGGVE